MVLLAVSLLLSVSVFSQGDSKQDKYYQFGYEVQQLPVGIDDDNPTEYLDSKIFIDNYTKTIKSSKIYQFFVSLITTSPAIYKASMDTIRLNETHHTQQKLDELIKTQKRTNQLLAELIQKNNNK